MICWKSEILGPLFEGVHVPCDLHRQEFARGFHLFAAPIDAGDLIENEEPRSTDTEMSELARSISNDSPAGLLTVAFSSHGSH